MIFFQNDYGMGAHEKVAAALNEINFEYNDSYGNDVISARVTDIISDLVGRDADVHLFHGGTATNKTCLAAFTRSYEAVIATDTGHISVHETGAVEATGHKIIEVPSRDGKMRPEQIEHVVKMHNMSQMVLPRVVYISDTTELGTVYTKAELAALRECCDRYGLYIYMDGARLADALTAPKNDLTYKDLGELCDAFYFGGTKCGALFGEAAVILNDDLKENFEFTMRQNGSLFAKAAFISVQFEALLKDGLYLELGKRANDMAFRLADGIRAKGYDFAYEPESNQIFPIFTNEKAEELARDVLYTEWEDRGDGTKIIRLATSWATDEKDVDDFLKLI
ncbi:MAG: threonine aldolase family protein [Anaerovoracaceae bacterium]|jgi:threonine aldolase